MEYITISHKRDHDCKIHAVSSEQHESTSVFNIIRDKGYWSSRKSDENMPEYIVLDFKENTTIDYIEMTASPNGPGTFPRDFRFEVSLDGNYWMVIHTERKLILDAGAYRLDIPLTLIRFLKILIIAGQENQGKYYSEIGRIRAGIAGISEIKASTRSSNARGPEHLLKDDTESYWETEHKAHVGKDSLTINLGKIFHVNRIILGSTETAFPENFYIETSSDNSVWLPLLEEKNFRAQENKKYFWNTDIRPARYIRIEAKGVKLANGKYGIQLAQLEISAAPFNPFHTHNIGDLTPYSSIFQAGIVRLAKDGDDTPGAAVQGNDRRLRDASTIFKGIVRLAEDGDETQGLSVQASDSRLKPATDLKPGIVRLAHNRESKEGAAVQGNDSRLMEATTANFGIVKLCPEGMYKESGVVTGNDPRLQKATANSFGICKLAADGADTAGTVVQANDRRLRTATSTYSGIVELAEDGENSAGVAVQGNDKRLKEATTTAKGIVELAEDGEESAGVVIQGNDRRLKDATTKSKGIVELAEDGEVNPGVAVQGNDRRLKDATTTSKGIVELAEDGENKAGVAV
ncbi:MAG: discoidin domain-containing protein, partial [Spirochaetes bacterium]|nr:discoidin domain-containing protein [Spirochaetota bacterium]